MGNCFTCFKVPPPTAQNTLSNNCHKEEMPEARLYSAPSHLAALSCNNETNHHHHLQHHQSASPFASTLSTLSTNGNSIAVTKSATAVINSSSTGGGDHTGGGSSGSGGGGGGGSLSRFCQRRAAARSAPAMGVADSKSSETKLNALFDVYKDANDDSILAEGIEQLCNDLQVSPDEFRVLVLAWKLNAEQMCRFTRTEFVVGCRAMHVDTIRAIQQRLPELVTEVEHDGELFKDLYRFTFRFGLDVATGQRILPTDMAVCLWRLVFSVREPPILERWLKFLENHPQFRGIPRDTWNMFLNFSESVGDDLSSYDDTEAWPSLFDDFVEYENDQMNQNISNKAKESDSLLITNEH